MGNYVQKSTTIAQTDDEISAAPVILTSPTNQEVSMQSKTSQRVQTQDQKAPVYFGQAPVSKPAKKTKVTKTKTKTTTSADQDTSKKTDTTTDNGIRVSPVRETLKPETSKPETSTSSKPAALDVETKTNIAVAKKLQEMKQKAAVKQKAAAIKRAKELSEQKKEKMKKEKARRTAAAKEAGRLAKLQREKIQFDKKEKEKAERLIQKEKTTKEEKEKEKAQEKEKSLRLEAERKLKEQESNLSQQSPNLNPSMNATNSNGMSPMTNLPARSQANDSRYGVQQKN